MGLLAGCCTDGIPSVRLKSRCVCFFVFFLRGSLVVWPRQVYVLSLFAFETRGRAARLGCPSIGVVCLVYLASLVFEPALVLRSVCA